MNQKQTILLILAVIFGVGIIGAIIAFLNSSKSSNLNSQKNSSSITNSSTPSSNNLNSISSQFKDGNYSVEKSYFVEGSSEYLKIDLVLKNGVITQIDSQYQTNDRESRQYQSAFDSVYKSQVVGKKLNEINLSRVAGASETTHAFMQAINQIESNASVK